MLDQPCSTQRYEPMPDESEKALTRDIVELASLFPKYGYRRITALLRVRGWSVNHKRTEDGRAVTLVVIDEYSRECLAIRVDRHIRSVDVIETLTVLMETRRVPEHIRSDNGKEFTAQAIRDWLGKVGAANPIHTASLTMGKRVCGELRREAQRRVAG